MNKIDRRWALGLAVASLLANLVWLGWIGLTDVDEAIFAEATREMVETGDFVTPRYNGEVRWDKPPAIYWAMAPALKLLGPTPFAARLTSAVAGAILVWLLVAAGTVLLSPAAGRWSGVVTATCLHGFFISHMSVTDMTLTLLMAAGWLGLFLATARQSPGWFLGAAVALALATLTKGPVAIILPGGSWLLFLLLRRQTWRTLGATHCWWGFLVYLLLLAPWCLAIYSAHGTAFYESFLGYHNLNRLTTTQSGHGGPVYEFVLIALLGILPWSGFLLAGVSHAWRRRARHHGFAGYLLLWAGLTIGLFSVSQTKLPNYITPAYPALALLCGAAIAEASAGRGRWRWGGIWLANLAGLIGFGGALMTCPVWLPRITTLTRELGRPLAYVGPGPAMAGATMLIAPVLILLVWLVRGLRPALVLNALGGWAGWLALWLGVAPVVYHYQQGTLRVMTIAADHHLAAEETLGTVNIHQPSIVFVRRQTIRRFVLPPGDQQAAEQLRQRFGSPRKLLLITRTRYVPIVTTVVPAVVWASRLGYTLLGNQSPPLGFSLPASPWTEVQARALEEQVAESGN